MTNRAIVVAGFGNIVNIIDKMVLQPKALEFDGNHKVSKFVQISIVNFFI